MPGKPPMKGEVIHIQIDPDEATSSRAESGLRVSGDAAARVTGGATSAAQA